MLLSMILLISKPRAGTSGGSGAEALVINMAAAYFLPAFRSFFFPSASKIWSAADWPEGRKHRRSVARYPINMHIAHMSCMSMMHDNALW